LEFENGEISDDALPEWQSVEEAPQITEYSVPLALQFNEDFTITLKSTYLKYEEVETVIVYVSNATNYIKVSEILEPSETDDGLYEMQIKGRLNEDDNLDGEEFRVHVAL